MTLALCVLYFGVLFALSAYGIHRFQLVMLCRRHRAVIGRAPELAGPPIADADLPIVTVQLPIFNESTVLRRLMRGVAKLDYPREKLHIQVLDDSIDETCALARAEVERLCAAGYDAVYIHRTDRVGYKAGALANGLLSAKGELIAIFDADFVPNADFCRALVGHFRDPGIAMVQARWAHLNRDVSLLTRVEALMLDGHHLVENRARFGAGYYFNFSGTGGMWRKAAIVDAGGWEHDTLTEDLDLSYRAQLKGWRFVYRPDVVSPAELPEDITATFAQQYRWAKGTVQTARKLLWRVMRSKLSISAKIEAFFHLTPHFTYPLMLLLMLLLLPVLSTVNVTDWQSSLLFDLPLCMAPITSLASFYMLAETAQGRSRWGALRLLPAIIGLGAGLAPRLARGVVEGLTQRSGEFVRTPKQGTNRWRYKADMQIPYFEMFCAVLAGTSMVMSVFTGHWFATPFTGLFTFGFGYVSYLFLAEGYRRRERARVAPPAVADASQPARAEVPEPAPSAARAA